MIEWWWLLVEAVVFLAYGAWSRGNTRLVTLVDALGNPIAAREELRRRLRSQLTDDALDELVKREARP